MPVAPTSPRTVLCPVDFSDGSRAALSYAAAIAANLQVPVIVLAVDDPLLVSAAAATHRGALSVETEYQLRQFIAETLPAGASNIDVRVAAGEPAPEILRVAGEIGHALIVMSTHGRTGLSKRLFGSTTERVLRETTVPVLVVPPVERG